MRLILVALLGLAAATASADTEVDMELVLAVDVSRSMSPWELEIQRRGYAEALVSEDVIAAITDGFTGRIAVTYMEWAGSGSTRVIIDWTVIASRSDAERVSADLMAHVPTGLRRTSISGAIDEAAALFDDNGFTAFRQVIDVSGDGPNNHGRPVLEARDAALERGIVINGLPLMTNDGYGGMWHLDDLDDYYLNCVIGGPGAFVIPVRDWTEFPDAVRRKLVLEIAGVPPAEPRVIPAQASVAEPYDCLIGERIWQRGRQWDWQ
jgi:hypothetical protein